MLKTEEINFSPPLPPYRAGDKRKKIKVMKRENIPPFYIGQEVVALSSKGPLIKGNKYTVTGNYCCIHCGIWNTSLKELPIESGIWACCHEEQWHDHPNLSCYSSRLAPITLPSCANVRH